MTDKHNANASKNVEDGHKTAHPVQNDAKGNTHSVHTGAAMKSPQASVHEKTGTHKEVSADPKFKDHNMHKDTGMKMQHGPGHETGGIPGHGTGDRKEICADPKCTCHDNHKDAAMKSSPMSVHEKTGTHKEVSADPRFKDHNMHKDAEMKGGHIPGHGTGDINTGAGMKSPHVSGHEKTGTHKDVSADPKFKDHNMHKDAEMKGGHVSHEKTGTHKNDSADAPLAANNMKEIHAQISGALAGAKFPFKTPAELISAFPNGASTKCHAGNFTMTVGEAGKLLKATDFPFVNAKAVADVIVQRASL